MTETRQRRIDVVGSLNIDLVTTTPRIPSGGETLTASAFATHAGGKGANQAVACARATRRRVDDGHADAPEREARDVRVSMIGAVGKDPYGDLLLSSLKEDGIDCEAVSKSGPTTGVAVILVEEATGENRILITPGANESMQRGSVVLADRSQPDLIVMQLEIPHETVLDVLAQAKKDGVDVLLNPAPAVSLPDEALDGLAHLVMNETEAAIMCGLEPPPSAAHIDSFLDAAFHALAAKGVKHIIITLGGNGVAFASPSGAGGAKWHKVPACHVDKVVDTTAAGDTFVGYYAVGLVRSQIDRPQAPPIESIVRFANQAAALTVTRQGAMDSIPYSSEVKP